MRAFVKSDWEEHLKLIRPLFELAGMVLTAAAWASISLTCSYLAVRGFFYTPSPALEAMGWMGSVVYWIIMGPFVIMASGSSILLLLAVWSMLVRARLYVLLTAGRSGWLVEALRLPYYFAAGSFLFLLVAIPIFQIMQALGHVPQPS